MVFSNKRKLEGWLSKKRLIVWYYELRKFLEFKASGFGKINSRNNLRMPASTQSVFRNDVHDIIRGKSEEGRVISEEGRGKYQRAANYEF